MGLKNISRRKFLAQTGCAAMGSTTLFSSLANLSLVNKLIGTASTPPSDYKALVCILLAGGNDSFNMLMPRGNDEYADYAATRSDLAIPEAISKGISLYLMANWFLRHLADHDGNSNLKKNTISV